MNGHILSRPLIPVASESDAETTASAAVRDLRGVAERVTVLTVIEKAGGALDKASVEQRREYAEEVFEAIVPELEAAGLDVETRIAYGTDVADSIIDVGAEIDATSIVFTPRESGLLARLFSGDVEHKLTTRSDRPVVALPRAGERE
jgi:nucleotide-binding universal stress UspA family protein